MPFQFCFLTSHPAGHVPFFVCLVSCLSLMGALVGRVVPGPFVSQHSACHQLSLHMTGLDGLFRSSRARKSHALSRLCAVWPPLLAPLLLTMLARRNLRSLCCPDDPP